MTMILHAGGDFAHNAKAYVRNMESENIKINQYDGKIKKISSRLFFFGDLLIEIFDAESVSIFLLREESNGSGEGLGLRRRGS